LSNILDANQSPLFASTRHFAITANGNFLFYKKDLKDGYVLGQAAWHLLHLKIFVELINLLFLYLICYYIHQNGGVITFRQKNETSFLCLALVYS